MLPIESDDLGQYPLAIKDHDQSIRLDPEFAGSRYNHGNTYSHLVQVRSAIRDYSETITLNP